MRKCIHTIVIDDWFPELCAITLPLIEVWAKRIGADFHLIKETKFPGFPPNYEKFQIWEAGKGYEWNIYLDADMVINPEKIYDFTRQDPRYFYFESELLNPKELYRSHPYFMRDGRNFGVSDCFLITSLFTHDLWHPHHIDFDLMKRFCVRGERMVSEFAINLNIARFGLKGLGSIGSDESHFHLQTTDDENRPFNGGKAEMTKEEHIARALEKKKELGI
jgi:hypothetical protein